MTLSRASLPLTLILTLAAAAAVAGPPLEGVYNSSDLGGDVETGRYMEAYEAPEGAILPGTTLHAQSWDGMSLGTQWSYQCGVMVDAPVLISDFVGPTGTGSRTYAKTFVGGDYTCTWSIGGPCDFTDTTGSDEIIFGYFDGGADAWIFKPDDGATAATNPTYTQNAIITNLTITAGVGDAVRWTATGQGTSTIARAEA